MKRFIVFGFILASISSFSQKIEVNEIDKFTKQRRVETNGETLTSGLGSGLSVKLRAVDNTCFITLKGYGKGADVIGRNDKVILLFSNDSTISGFSTGIQDYKIEQTQFGSVKSFSHQYEIPISELAKASKLELKSIRKYGTDTYVDIDIPSRNKEKLAKLSGLFVAVLR